MENRTHFEIHWPTLWRIAIFCAFIGVLYLARGAVSAFLVAIVLSLGLDPIVSALQGRRINRLLGTIFIFLFGLILISTAAYFIVPIIILEASSFISDFNKIVSTIFGFGIPQAIIKNLDLTLDKALGFITSANISIAGALSTVFRRLVLVLATFIITFYLSIEKGGAEKLFKVLLPDLYEKPFLVVFNRFRIKIGRWFAAQAGLSLLIGTVVAFGLWLLGVRYFLILGILAALFEIVPIIGPVLAGATAFLVAVSDSFSLGLSTLIFFFVVQQLENHVLIPIIMGAAMKIHPVIVVISLLAGGQVAGFLGVLLSVPIAVAAQETFTYLAERKSSRARLDI